MNKTIIYDFDGTLINSEKLIPIIYKKIYHDFGLQKLSNTELQQLRKISISDLIKKFKISPLQLPKIIKRTQQEMGLLMHELDWQPEIKAILSDLNQKNFKQGILTSNSVKNVNLFLNVYSNSNYFEFIHSGRNIFGKDKVLKKLIKKYQLDLSHTVYVGDEVRDIEACQKIGLKIIAVDWGFDDHKLLKQAKPDYLVSSPCDIEKIIT